ncbi:uncharacterized protein TRIADDRAFT_58497 [Trichoplax adhaerens]|uniref:Small ribosomal subunit protein bS18m n=1 Tax=Trichoplax adhaerens TaxID=10228 RepID=B3S2V7_TRIAD|nr:hypothetical protein TRIADDRAFT_58497 [Trichoplax adhaerens]EDV22687.1 hypothetical protein TRIADDRAFT_58497 [Trichoplax adhaerens]|eukprot:XP_002114553.1 hypothetical protein TRIADDRAFT_58497 [Trichoplax adhaerens]
MPPVRHHTAIFSAGPTRARRLKPEELRPIKNKVDEDGNPLPCALCKIKIDYKNVRLLSQFISNDTGMIYGRRITGLCGHKQKELTKAIRRARTMGFMPYTYKYPEYLNDPKPF